MDRKEFFGAAMGCCAGVLVGIEPAVAQTAPAAAVDPEKEFVKHWMEDLFESMDKVLDQETKVKVMAGCGQGCFRRHEFKREIARQGKGDLEKLLTAYHKNFEAWKEGGKVHIRFGEVSTVCYCPAAKYHPVRPNDMHCECTRATHQAIFETAMGREVKVEVVESLRRGGKTCHFVAHVG